MPWTRSSIFICLIINPYYLLARWIFFLNSYNVFYYDIAMREFRFSNPCHYTSYSLKGDVDSSSVKRSAKSLSHWSSITSVNTMHLSYVIDVKSQRSSRGNNISNERRSRIWRVPRPYDRNIPRKYLKQKINKFQTYVFAVNVGRIYQRKRHTELIHLYINK